MEKEYSFDCGRWHESSIGRPDSNQNDSRTWNCNGNGMFRKTSEKKGRKGFNNNKDPYMAMESSRAEKSRSGKRKRVLLPRTVVEGGHHGFGESRVRWKDRRDLEESWEGEGEVGLYPCWLWRVGLLIQEHEPSGAGRRDGTS